MKKASITEAKNGLSALIDSVKAGASVLITDRGRPVARLEPVGTATETADQARLAPLIRDAVVRPGRAKKLPKSFFTRELPRLKGDASVVEALLEERREGR
jgi:prevent-host-death family protein